MPLGAWRDRSLTLRILILLTLALMPLGAVAVWQTQRIATQAASEAEATLLAVTEHAVNPLQGLFMRAFGSVRALAPTLADIHDRGASCDAFLAEFVARAEAYSYAAFVDVDGQMTCSSDGRRFDFSAFPSFADSLADSRASVTLSPDAPLSGQPVLIVTEPVAALDGPVLGFLSLSVPTRDAVLASDLLPDRPTPLLTFNDRGEVLSYSDPTGADRPVDVVIPRGLTLGDLVGGGDRAFAAQDGDGEARLYAIVTIVPDLYYAVSVWPEDMLAARGLDRFVLTGLMPVLMWIASLLVAVLAFERLVFRNIRVLGRQMRSFAEDRRLPSRPKLADAGAEIGGIESDFRDMAKSILQDEATLEDALREKNILLKEVHHRVKNNLQLISSIMNMQARRLESDEARDVLRRVQDRVMGLAAVHRSLYTTPDLGRIDVGAVVADLARQVAVNGGGQGGVDFTAEVDEVPIAPDEAVTLSLAVSEAMTNAVDRTAKLEGADRRPIRLTLTRDGDGHARLTIRNPSPDGCAPEADGSGLGAQLIRAYTRQIDGVLETRTEDGDYVLDIRFPTEDRRMAARDY